MIINDESKIFNILEQYEKSANEQQLTENIINIVRPKTTRKLEITA